ncbi:PREDICTED: uncharacterized protein LOC106743647 [Dinoponera quadriceps]|uniref:Uncharacterized protein LOC106743647 n=1 Tax=Dinoponera quadriceps TaxID=609295 RepID=A0A6P3X5K3_DINQU|nr:PREDICTED: uncharacterized protein LOC106743647 [Dinoponera quadriceps]
MIDKTTGLFGTKYGAPMFKSPFSDAFLQIGSLQFKKDCAPYELMFADCMEAYGHHIGLDKCRTIFNDMYECTYRVKRIRRVIAMNKERIRQYKNGERKEYYPQGPPIDLY